MGRDRRSTTADLPLVEEKPQTTPEAEAEQAVDWPAEGSATGSVDAEAAFRDAEDNTLDVAIDDRGRPVQDPPPASIDVDFEAPDQSVDVSVSDLDDADADESAENVRFPGDETEAPEAYEPRVKLDEPDFDSVDIAVDDIPGSIPPDSVDAEWAAELDEDVLIEPVDVAARPPEPTRAVEAPDPQPVSPVTLVSAQSTPDGEPFEPMTVAIAGGKGGVGRSLLVANLSLFVAHLNRSVVACDLAPDGANLHTFLGMEPLLPNTGSMLRGGGGPHVESFPGLNLRLCRSPMPISMGRDDPHRAAALEHARSLNAQVLILDLGTHADALTLDSFNDADASIIVTTPEPVAMERSYGFLRAALFRRLLHGEGDAPVVARALLAADHVGQLDTPDDLVAAMRGVNPSAAEALAERVAGFCPKILLNHCRSRADRQLGKGIASALRHRWGITAEPFGALEHDDAAVEASRRRRPLMMEYPGSILGVAIDRIARKLVAQKTRQEARA